VQQKLFWAPFFNYSYYFFSPLLGFLLLTRHLELGTRAVWFRSRLMDTLPPWGARKGILIQSKAVIQGLFSD